MKRRGFLAGLAAAVVAPLVPRAKRGQAPRASDAEIANAIDREVAHCETMRATFRVVVDGPIMKSGTVAPSNGRLAVYAGAPFVCLWFPPRTGEQVAVSVEDVEPMNERARELLSVLKRVG